MLIELIAELHKYLEDNEDGQLLICAGAVQLRWPSRYRGAAGGRARAWLTVEKMAPLLDMSYGWYIGRSGALGVLISRSNSLRDVEIRRMWDDQV